MSSSSTSNVEAPSWASDAVGTAAPPTNSNDSMPARNTATPQPGRADTSPSIATQRARSRRPTRIIRSVCGSRMERLRKLAKSNLPDPKDRSHLVVVEAQLLRLAFCFVILLPFRIYHQGSSLEVG